MVKVRDLGSRECGFESRPPYKFPCCRKELLQYTDNVAFLESLFLIVTGRWPVRLSVGRKIFILKRGVRFSYGLHNFSLRQSQCRLRRPPTPRSYLYRKIPFYTGPSVV